MRHWSSRALIVVIFAWLACPVTRAAEFDGVQLPDRIQVDGDTLIMNGIGLRTYSFFRIPIYVAALYLKHPTTSPETVIYAPETKLLIFKFKHSVTADEARHAWREGLEANCVAPCRLNPADVARFLAAIPPMYAGQSYSILFDRKGASISAEGRVVGIIPRLRFAQAMLATFFGPQPASEQLKLALLQGDPH